ncbi:flagellar assembly protein FliW [Paenibacillus lautus]|uniref:flagellar assembly protein FliW n=1 Tax=Paenibacillus TaxID=44249 RepID=UPI00240CFF17|nr:flagellar assembly protein FliW [Paenibacillus sp. BR1-192]MBY0163238.1 flagellar assembly protein FliW [Cytobacillus firmus]WFB58172.1 flagellar assembly protein FliW [Paenibacillus sp. BR1-192]
MVQQLNAMRVSFEGSILGFEKLNEFELEVIKDTSFLYLKSLEQPDIAFLTTSPFEWYTDYSLVLDERIKNKLLLEDPEGTLVLCIVTLQDSLDTSTINLVAPLIVNVEKRLGNQHVLQKVGYQAKSPLIVKKDLEEEEV